MKFRRLVPGLLVLAASSPAFGYTVKTVLKNGPDLDKKVIAIIGDGYTDAEMTDFQQYVKDTIVDQLLTKDSYLRAHQSAFNIYRVEVASPSSPVSYTRYSAGCGTLDHSDDVVDAACFTAGNCYAHDTAFDFTFTGCWGRCWMEPSATSAASIKAVLDQAVPKRDYEIYVLRTPVGDGGCGKGNASPPHLAVTSQTDWAVIAHELGHMVGGLDDEYTAPANAMTAYPSTSPQFTKNCTTNLSATIEWSDLLSVAVPPKTIWNPLKMNSVTTVGAFEGCSTYGLGIYRPAYNCRMNQEHDGEIGISPEAYCPVCAGVLNQVLNGYVDDFSDYIAFENDPGASCRGSGATAVSINSNADVENRTTSPAPVFCPARRVTDGTNFTNWFSGAAFVIDRSSTADVCCNVYARGVDGNSASGTSVCSSGSGPDYQGLKLDFPKTNMNATFAHIGVQCTIPGTDAGNASSVISYRLIQQRY